MSSQMTRIKERIPGGAVRWWFWMPVAALPVAVGTIAAFGGARALRETWGVVPAAVVTAAGLGGIASLALHRRPLGAGAAAAIGLVVAVASFYAIGPVLVIGEQLLAVVGAGPYGDVDDMSGLTLLFGVFGLLFTWWYALPVGALFGLIAWRAARSRSANRPL
jgi:hypothetical protein